MSRLLRPILILSPLPFAGALFYTYASRKLAKDYPEVPLEQLPEGSFTRRLVEESRARGLTRWGEEGKERERYAAYYNIYQTTVPRSHLESYGSHLLQGPTSRPAYLTAAYTHAFFTSGLISLEHSLMSFGSKPKADEREQRGVFERGMEAIPGLMWVFDSSAAQSSASALERLAFPEGQEPPSSAPPPMSTPQALGQALGKGEGSTVFFWRTPTGLVRAFDRMAEWGYPWRLMLGGWHELVVEELPASSPTASSTSTSTSTSTAPAQAPGNAEPMVRLTFTAVHIYDTLGKGDMRQVPSWTRGVHETFGRAILGSTVRRVERG